MQDIDQRNQLKALLNKHWKLRSDLVGNQSVEDLITAVQAGYPPDAIFRRTEGGTDFDMYHALQILVEAATLLKSSIDIYNALALKLKRKPTPTELENEVKA